MTSITREDSAFVKITDFVFASRKDNLFIQKNKEKICSKLKKIYDSKSQEFFVQLSLYNKRSMCGYYCRKTLEYPDIKFVEKEVVEKDFREKLEKDNFIERITLNMVLDRLILGKEMDEKLYEDTKKQVMNYYNYKESLFTPLVTFGEKKSDIEPQDIYQFCLDYLNDPNFHKKYFKKDYSDNVKEKISRQIESNLFNEISMAKAKNEN